MLNICISLAKLPRFPLNVNLLCGLVGELSRNKAYTEADKAALECMFSLVDGDGLTLEQHTQPTIELLSSRLKSECAQANLRYLSEYRKLGREPSELAIGVLSGEGEELATMNEINRLLENPVELVKSGWFWPYVYVALRAVHAGQTALNNGNVQDAFAFAAAAVSSINRDSGTGIGDEYEVVEALGVLLARIAMSKFSAAD